MTFATSRLYQTGKTFIKLLKVYKKGKLGVRAENKSVTL